MSFEFYGHNPKQVREPALTVDKYGRIYLNTAAQKMLGYEKGKSKSFYIGYEGTNRRIGLAKPELTHLVDTRPVTFDAGRAYASVRGFLRHYNIPHDRIYRYIFVGKENNTNYMFELEEYNAPDAKSQPKVRRRKKGQPTEATE